MNLKNVMVALAAAMLATVAAPLGAATHTDNCADEFSSPNTGAPDDLRVLAGILTPSDGLVPNPHDIWALPDLEAGETYTASVLSGDVGVRIYEFDASANPTTCTVEDVSGAFTVDGTKDYFAVVSIDSDTEQPYRIEVAQ